jgi:Fe-S-cluster-containing dehydrogenase component
VTSYEGDVSIKSSKDGHVLARVQVPLGATMIVADGGTLEREKDGKDPACVSVCPTHCMYFGDLDDPKSEVATLLRTRKPKTLLAEAGTKPRVFYLTK